MAVPPKASEEADDQGVFLGLLSRFAKSGDQNHYWRDETLSSAPNSICNALES